MRKCAAHEKDRCSAPLHREREEKEKETLYEAYKKGKRSLKEVLDFIKGKADL